MDATQQQEKVDSLKVTVANDEQTLQTDSSSLKDAQAELDNVNQINWLESLTPEQVTSINEALGSDTDNKTGITLALPPAQV